MSATERRDRQPLDRHPELEPFPRGWFCAGFAHELARGTVLSRRLAGEEIVVFRTASGRCVAMDAWCPHMGAHLGRTGATVEGESIPARSMASRSTALARASPPATAASRR